MALSIAQILAGAKVDGLTLVKINTPAGNYFVAEYRGFQSSIYVNAIGHMERSAWIDALLGFVTAVMQGETSGFVPVGAEEAPAEEAPAEEAAGKPLAVKVVHNVDGSITVFAARKKVEHFVADALSPAEHLEFFLQGWFGSHPRHVRTKVRSSKKSGK